MERQPRGMDLGLQLFPSACGVLCVLFLGSSTEEEMSCFFPFRQQNLGILIKAQGEEGGSHGMPLT